MGGRDNISNSTALAENDREKKCDGNPRQARTFQVKRKRSTNASQRRNTVKSRTSATGKEDDTFYGIDEKTAMAGLSFANALIVKNMKKSRRITLIFALFAVVLAVVIGVFIGPELKALLTPKVEEPPVAVINEMTDEEKAELLKNKTLVIKNIVLGVSNQHKELLVLEQEVEVEVQWESSWGGLDIFKKAKRIISYGTGYFNIDLSAVSEDSINVDHENKLVSITVPHAVLKSISIDEGRTVYEDTQKGILSFGDLKLTMEQQGLMKQSVEEKMREKLETSEMLEQADEAGKLSVAEIYQPFISLFPDEYSEYRVEAFQY